MVSWFGFAQPVLAANGLDPPGASQPMAPPSCAPAPRPAYSVLGHNVWANTGLTLMRDWDDARTQAVAERALEPIG
ncbi:MULTISPECIES: sugar nucleotide-binding protein [unclassified Cryobacterium]|uniref:sugar nucleotide-binding protein n=1 Tax=unclassified Cryobacterium TaxID=2649013 RepID=UPI00106B5D44|nr:MULTISPECIES: sugar nucleotide-binding protein [Cryobacterium]TFC05693.1 hypothetical protein E3O59_12750 [Cryobacterium sp. MDB2-33-2]